MSYKFVMDYSLHDPSETAVWRGNILDEEDYIVCEVFNNGDGGGNFYIWHNGEARWGIEAEALQAYAGDDNEAMAVYREAGIIAPMDAWIEDLRNAEKQG